MLRFFPFQISSPISQTTTKIIVIIQTLYQGRGKHWGHKFVRVHYFRNPVTSGKSVRYYIVEDDRDRGRGKGRALFGEVTEWLLLSKIQVESEKCSRIGKFRKFALWKKFNQTYFFGDLVKGVHVYCSA